MDRASQILIFFLLSVAVVVIFLARVFNLVGSGEMPVTVAKSEIDSAIRGAIITADGYHIARSYKTYTVAIDPLIITPEKEELFARLFSIYTGTSEAEIRQALKGSKRVVLLKDVDAKRAKYLKELSRNLYKEKVFSERRIKGGRRTILKGLEISENQFIRFYPYIETLEPLVGYVRKDSLTGIVGIEKQYDQYLSPQRDATLEGVRDVGGNIILNKISSINYHEDGYDLELSIMMPLQKELEETLTAYRNDLQADEVMAAVMESKTGRILAIASSNRYTPNAIKPRDVPSIKLGMIQYIFEPGSIIKPIVFSILLDRGKLSPDQMINGYGGRYTMGTKVITDEHKMGIMRAEEAIIYSSNIAMAQLSQRLEAEEYIEGLRGFGFAQKSGIDLPYEYSGDIPTLSQMRSEIYKATVSYGYGMRANFMQLLKAYNVFNNDGKLITPRVGLALRNGHTRYTIEQPQPVQIISPRTAQTMMSILRKTVTEGTGKKTDIEGVLIGGKTGTAHIARAGRYQNFYNSSFFGYANDAKHRYTIGTVVINPKTSYFASETAAPIFRSIVERMGKRGMIYIPPLPDTNTTDSFTGHFPQVQ